jgi:hypothetical protein
MKSDETEKKIKDLIEFYSENDNNKKIIFEKGNPASAIIKICKNEKIDLLISGALEQEHTFKFYFGSISRRLMRELSSATLILKNPSLEKGSFKSFYINADYSVLSEKAIKYSYKFALAEKAKEFVIIRDFYAPVLSSSIIDSGSIKEVEKIKKNWIIEETEKMKLFIKELNLTEIEPKIVCLYGKQGWEAGKYARENNAEIFVVSNPPQKSKILSRLFLNRAEYAFEKLPSNLLIVR